MKHDEPWTPYSGESLNRISHFHRASKSFWHYYVGYQQHCILSNVVINIITDYTQDVTACLINLGSAFASPSGGSLGKTVYEDWSVNLAERRWSFILLYSNLVQLYNVEKQIVCSIHSRHEVQFLHWLNSDKTKQIA